MWRSTRERPAAGLRLSGARVIARLAAALVILGCMSSSIVSTAMLLVSRVSGGEGGGCELGVGEEGSLWTSRLMSVVAGSEVFVDWGGGSGMPVGGPTDQSSTMRSCSPIAPISAAIMSARNLVVRDMRSSGARWPCMALIRVRSSVWPFWLRSPVVEKMSGWNSQWRESHSVWYFSRFFCSAMSRASWMAVCVRGRLSESGWMTETSIAREVRLDQVGRKMSAGRSSEFGKAFSRVAGMPACWM